MSGGQQQRVGVARALAADPDILLMDEPFAALDPVSRAALQTQVRRLHAESGKTIIFVTHDMNEALRLASQIVVMNAGRVVQSGEPAAILLRPEGDFVRGFLGREDLPLRLLDLATVGEIARPLAEAGGGGAGPLVGTPDAIMQPSAQTPGGGARPLAGTPAEIVRPLTEAPSDGGAARIAATATLRQALTLMLEHRSARLLVENESGDITGEIEIDDIIARHGAP